jgi:hypothetical protein
VPFLWYLSLGKQRKVLARLHWRLLEEANIKAGEKPLQRPALRLARIASGRQLPPNKHLFWLHPLKDP